MAEDSDLVAQVEDLILGVHLVPVLQDLLEVEDLEDNI